MRDPIGSPSNGIVSPASLASVQLHVAVLLFGLAGLFARWLPVHPLLIVLGRTSVAAVALALWLGARAWLRSRRGREPLSARATGAAAGSGGRFWLLAATGGVVLAVHWGAFFQAIQVSTLGLALVSYSTAPVFTALLEPLVFRERLSRRTMAAALASLVGVAILVPLGGLADQAARGTLEGIAWGVFAGASFGVLALVNRGLVARRGAAEVALVQDAVAALLLAPLLPLIGQALTWNQLGLLLALGVLCTAVAHGLFIAALRHVGAGTAAVVSTLEPVYGILLAMLLLGEVPTPRTVVGGLVILAGALGVTLALGPARSDAR